MAPGKTLLKIRPDYDLRNSQESLRSPEESLPVKLRISRILNVARYFSPLILLAHFKYIQGSDSPYRLSS